MDSNSFLLPAPLSILLSVINHCHFFQFLLTHKLFTYTISLLIFLVATRPLLVVLLNICSLQNQLMTPSSHALVQIPKLEHLTELITICLFGHFFMPNHHIGQWPALELVRNKTTLVHCYRSLRGWFITTQNCTHSQLVGKTLFLRKKLLLWKPLWRTYPRGSLAFNSDHVGVSIFENSFPVKYKPKLTLYY